MDLLFEMRVFLFLLSMCDLSHHVVVEVRGQGKSCSKVRRGVV